MLYNRVYTLFSIFTCTEKWQTSYRSTTLIEQLRSLFLLVCKIVYGQRVTVFRVKVKCITCVSTDCTKNVSDAHVMSSSWRIFMAIRVEHILLWPFFVSFSFPLSLSFYRTFHYPYPYTFAKRKSSNPQIYLKTMLRDRENTFWSHLCLWSLDN